MNMIRPKKTLTVGAREANQRFSHYLREVELGSEIIITKNGRAVARLSAIDASVDERARQRSIDKMAAMMKRGLPVKYIGRRLTRDELNER
jgi:prevent-host-death family protein